MSHKIAQWPPIDHIDGVFNSFDFEDLPRFVIRTAGFLNRIKVQNNEERAA